MAWSTRTWSKASRRSQASFACSSSSASRTTSSWMSSSPCRSSSAPPRRRPRRTDPRSNNSTGPPMSVGSLEEIIGESHTIVYWIPGAPSARTARSMINKSEEPDVG